ncbi:hypothetical protein BH23BAC1_BH23BAC1_04520 [soil metagenome]
MVIELALFSHESLESGIKLEPNEADQAVAALTKELILLFSPASTKPLLLSH